jgi:DOPA 4,5-dioxygenase
MTRRPSNLHARYHAHVYFGADEAAQAAALCGAAGARFGLAVGRVQVEPVGPHPVGSCQISFGQVDFEALIPWLEAHRGGLTVLVHGLTGQDLADHTDHAAWLGEPAPLNLAVFGG